MKIWGMFRFTLGETLRKGTLIFYFAVATIIILFFAASINRSSSDPTVITMFGQPIPSKNGTGSDIIALILIGLFHQSVAAIILFGIFGVAGLIPSMLEKGTIDLFLSKPLSRGELLLSRALGATAGIAVNIIYFIFGIWIIFGFKVGVWYTGFLESSLFVAFAYACLFSVVALVGLLTRSTGYSILLTFIFFFISLELGSREYGLYFLWDNVVYHRLLDALYYLTPQVNAMLANASRFVAQSSTGLEGESFTWMPFLYSFVSTAFLYSIAIWYFSRRDY